MKTFRWLIWTVLIGAATFGIWRWKFRPSKTEVALNIEHAHYGNFTNAVTATGTVQPVDTVAVGTQVSGIIQKVFVDFNTPVKKGQLLAQLDKSLLNAQVAQITANLQAARANAVYQKSNYDRQNHLYAVGAISKAEQEAALYQYSSAVQSVNSIAAQLRSAQKNLSYTNIHSPIDGTVLSRSVSEGQTVAASLSTPTLFSIAKDLTNMQVQASIDEADIGNVKVGQRALFTVDAFPADTFSGRVKEIRLRSSVSANVVSYITIIEAPNPDLKLKPGMTASITVYTKELNNILLVPAQAKTFQPDSVLAKKFIIDKSPVQKKAATDSGGRAGKTDFVWLKKDNRLIRHPVLTGLDDETQIQILAGLKPSDEIVVGYQEVKKAGKTTAKSPFMPSRPGRSTPRGNAGPPH